MGKRHFWRLWRFCHRIALVSAAARQPVTKKVTAVKLNYKSTRRNHGAIGPATRCASIFAPFQRIDQCRCGPVARPVAPTAPSLCP